MTARHSSSRPRQNPAARKVVLFGAALVAAVVVLGLVVAGLSKVGAAGLCSARPTVTVAAEPGITDQVETLAREAGDACFTYQIEAVSSGELASRLATREALPDLWIPDSAVRLAQVSQDVQIPFETVLNSIASTPVVIASRDTQVDMGTWTSALSTKGLKMGDPLLSGTADAPILAATSEVEGMRATKETLGASLAALAQGQAGREGLPPTEDELLDQVVATGGAAIVSEQHGVLAQRDAPDSGLQLAAPRTGAVFLTYPLAVTTQDAGRRDEMTEAAHGLREAATAAGFTSGLAESGFRGADRAPLADGAGVGETEALVVRDPTRLQTTLQRWRLLAMPTRSLVLMDTSGSMATPVSDGGKSRIEMLLETASMGLGQFPNDAALGVWAFGGAAGKEGRPYTEVVPLERLDARVGDGTHRQSLGAALGTLPGLVGGGTDLYQSVLDAYGKVQSTYDPNMVNCIIVISDGANDTVSALSKEEFFTKLRGAVDPSRPVIVVTIGLLDDADPATLGEIAEATGGSSHIAETPQEIVTVFAEAIQKRGAA